GSDAAPVRRVLVAVFEHDASELDARFDAELPEDVTKMHACGVTRHEHLGSDLCVREALGDEMGDAPLGLGESGPACLFGRLADPVPERRAAVQHSFTYALGVARRTRGGIGRDRPAE